MVPENFSIVNVNEKVYWNATHLEVDIPPHTSDPDRLIFEFAARLEAVTVPLTYTSPWASRA